VVGEPARHRGSDLGYAQPVEQARQLRARGALDRVHKVARGCLGEPLELDEPVGAQLEDVGQALHHALDHELPGRLLAESFDVETGPRREVPDPAGELRRAAEPVGAEDLRPVRDEARATGRANFGHPERLAALAAFLLDPLHDLRNHVARPLHAHEVAFADVLASDFLGVVQVRPAHRHAADLHRLHERNRRDDARATDARHDAENAGDLDPWCELECERPARMVRGRAELGADRDVVQLDHTAVDLDGQVVALGL
jgi:hypothetical protein